jgi:hypothetical protein
MFITFNILAIAASICLLLMNRKFIFQHILKFIKKGHGETLTK